MSIGCQKFANRFFVQCRVGENVPGGQYCKKSLDPWVQEDLSSVGLAFGTLVGSAHVVQVLALA